MQNAEPMETHHEEHDKFEKCRQCLAKNDGNFLSLKENDGKFWKYVCKCYLGSKEPLPENEAVLCLSCAQKLQEIYVLRHSVRKYDRDYFNADDIFYNNPKFNKCRLCLKKLSNIQAISIFSDDRLKRAFIKCFQVATLTNFVYDNDKAVVCSVCADRLREFSAIRYVMRNNNDNFFKTSFV